MRFFYLIYLRLFGILQFRQLIPEHAYDLFASVRQCGGPHTLTVPHRKLIKMPTNIVDDTAQSVPPTTNHK